MCICAAVTLHRTVHLCQCYQEHTLFNLISPPNNAILSSIQQKWDFGTICFVQYGGTALCLSSEYVGLEIFRTPASKLKAVIEVGNCRKGGNVWDVQCEVSRSVNDVQRPLANSGLRYIVWMYLCILYLCVCVNAVQRFLASAAPVIVWCNNRKYRGQRGELNIMRIIIRWQESFWNVHQQAAFYHPSLIFVCDVYSFGLIRLFQPSKAQVYPAPILCCSFSNVWIQGSFFWGLKEGIGVGRCWREECWYNVELDVKWRQEGLWDIFSHFSPNVVSTNQ